MTPISDGKIALELNSAERGEWKSWLETQH